MSCYYIQFGATPLHMLCMNEAMSQAHLRALLLMCSEDAFVQDVVSVFESFYDVENGRKSTFSNLCAVF